MTTQYGGGGAERVVSYLLSVYAGMGYEVFLITSKYQHYGEYDMPKGVHRIDMEYLLSDPEGRGLKELEDIINARNIDLLCIHQPYEGEVLFYFIVLAKMMGVYVIVENHTSFINAIRQRGGLRNQDKIYRLAEGWTTNIKDFSI